MPWQLNHQPKEGTEGEPLNFVLPVAGHLPTYSVGRKEADIILRSDKSVSRSHAELRLAGATGATELTVRDLKSKFGVFIGSQRLEEEAHSVTDGSMVKFGTTNFQVRRVPLVLCASNISGTDKQALKAWCESIDARLVKEWCEEVTHLVVQQIQWTPKFLTALASLVPVVGLEWVREVASRAVPADPLPDASLPRFAPSPGSQSGVDERTCLVNPARATLYQGRRVICLPPPSGSTDAKDDTARLLRLMGAEVHPWPDDTRGDACKSFVQSKARDGFSFLLHPDDASKSTAEAQAVLAHRAELLSPMLVRTSLIYGVHRTEPPTARMQPPTHIQPAPRANAEADPGAATQAAPETPAPQRPQQAPACSITAAHHSRPISPPCGAQAPPDESPERARGWQSRRKKESPQSARAEPSAGSSESAIAEARTKEQPAQMRTEAMDAEENVEVPCAAACGAPSAAVFGAETRAEAAPTPTAAVPVIMPGGWRKRARSMLSEGSEAAANAPATAEPQSLAPTAEREFYGKRFRKVGGRGPGALVRVTMETIVAGLDGASGAEGADELSGGQIEMETNELFEEVIANRGRRMRR